jgi:ketosteroid isomerase-like protein
MTKAFSTDSEADIAAVNDFWPQYCASFFQRQDDGSWKIARDCFNGNGPAE